MHQFLENFFLGFLASEPKTIAAVGSFPGKLYIENGCLVFSLLALHEFLKQLSQKNISFAEFQRQIYQSTLNQDLKAHGAQIVVHYSTGKVETNLYRLERIVPADSSG